MSEPAILVKRTNSSQVWSMEKLENKIIDMRELYEDQKSRGEHQEEIKGPDPFFESQENHNLIGVANIFLECLFHDVTLDYHAPIISQQGEVAGRLQVIFLKMNNPVTKKVVRFVLFNFSFVLLNICIVLILDILSKNNPDVLCILCF